MQFRRPMPLRNNSPAAWAFAAVAFLLAVAARFALYGVMPTGTAFATFIPAVLLTTYFAGFWPGVAVAILSVLAGWYFFIPPGFTFYLSQSGIISIVTFAAVVAVAIAIVQFIRSTLDKLSEEQQKSAELARQRELLFSELQHRISNNLSIVSALLNLERAGIEDERAKQALTEAATRLAMIAKIHRKLHDPAGAELRFGGFMEELCHDVLEASGKQNVKCAVSAADINIPSEKIVPIALIVTELLSNALEHGYSNGRSGTVEIRVAPQNGGLVLIVADNGHGVPPGFSVDQSKGMGLRIVDSLARQIEGSFAIKGEGGTTCTVAFSP